MEKLDFNQMESLHGGIDWCGVRWGITGIGGVICALGGTFTCGIAAAAYGAIAISTILYCQY